MADAIAAQPSRERDALAGIAASTLAIPAPTPPHPFLFTAAWQLSLMTPPISHLRTCHRPRFSTSKQIITAVGKFTGLHPTIAVTGQLDYATFDLAVRHNEITIVNTVCNDQGLIAIAFTHWLFCKDRRYTPFNVATALCFIAAIAAITITLLSRRNAPSAAKSITFTGSLITILATFLAAASIPHLRWGADYAAAHYPDQTAPQPAQTELAHTLLDTLISCSIAVPAQVALHSILDHQATHSFDTSSLAPAIIGGTLVNPTANILWRRANILNANPGINTILNFPPIISISRLLAAHRIDVQRLDYLIIGT